MSDATTAPQARLGRNELEALFEDAPCGYVILTPDGRITRANRTLAGWVGATPDDLSGRHLRGRSRSYMRLWAARTRIIRVPMCRS